MLFFNTLVPLRYPLGKAFSRHFVRANPPINQNLNGSKAAKSNEAKGHSRMAVPFGLENVSDLDAKPCVADLDARGFCRGYNTPLAMKRFRVLPDF